MRTHQVFDRMTGKPLGWSKWDVPAHDPNSQVVVPMDRPANEDERWDGQQGVRPVSDAERLSARKAERVIEIDRRTVALIQTGFEFDGETFSLSDAAQRNWIALYAARSTLPYPVAVTTKIDSTHSIVDESTMKAFGEAALLAAKLHVDSGRAIKSQVLSAETIAEVEAIVDSR